MKSALLLLALVPLAFAAGPLTPPGAPAPTMKSLDEVEPRTPLTQSDTPGDATAVFKITKPGSYYLTGNLVVPAGKHGVVTEKLGPDHGRAIVDLMGFTISGTNAGATASGFAVLPGDFDGNGLTNGTISGFAGGNVVVADPNPATAPALEISNLHLLGGGDGVRSAGRVIMNNVRIENPGGSAVKMGSDSVLSHVWINASRAGIPKIIEGTGSGHRLGDITLISPASGASVTASAILLGPDSRVSGLTARITGGTFTGPIFGNTSGFSEVSGLTPELTGCTAPVAVSNWATFPSSWAGPELDATKNFSDAGILAIKAGIPKIIALNCTFTQTIVNYGPDNILMGLLLPTVILDGTTTTPTVCRVDGHGLTVAARISIAPTASVTGPVMDVSGNGNVVSSSIRGLPSGGTGILISGGRSTRVTGCSIAARNDGPATAIKIAAGVTNALVNNENVSEFAAGSTVVDNLGGSSNAIAPILTTTASIAANTNPFAIIVR